MKVVCKDRLVNILALCVYSLQRFIEIQDSAGLVLDEAEAKESATNLRIHLHTYAVLADHYFKKRVLMYKIRCKSHYLYHISRGGGLENKPDLVSHVPGGIFLGQT